MAASRLKLGIVGDEFFDPDLERMGGYGWAVRKVAEIFTRRAELGVDVVFLTNAMSRGGEGEILSNGSRLLLHQRNRLDQIRRVRVEQIDLLLAIDYNPSHRFFYGVLPRTPVIIWIRDPRPRDDWEIVESLQIPGSLHRPKGIDRINTGTFVWEARLSRVMRRPLLYATPAPSLARKAKDTFGVAPAQLFLLPNPLTPNLHPVTKSPRPLVAFLGRLDPIKRPWLVLRLAEHFPHVDFVLMGKAHFHGDGAWLPDRVPPNVRLTGHLGEAEKTEVLSRAWALINTSIHEGLAVSMLEALACETPIVSGSDPEGVASRFGSVAGEWHGSGLDGVPAFAAGLARLLEDEALRTRLGKAGRAWVEQTHSESQFLQRFFDLCGRIGLSTVRSSAEAGTQH